MFAFAGRCLFPHCRALDTNNISVGVHVKNHFDSAVPCRSDVVADDPKFVSIQSLLHGVRSIRDRLLRLAMLLPPLSVDMQFTRNIVDYLRIECTG